MSTYTLTYNSKLTEDFIHSDSILASPTATTPLATFVNANGQSEALVIQDDGELCHLQREPLSSSGWNIFGIGATGQSIAAANSGNVWMADAQQGIWQSNAGHWNQMGYIDVDDVLCDISVGRDGTFYALAGPDEIYHLFTYDPASGTFQDTGVVPIDTAPVGSPGSLWSLSSSSTVMTSSSPGQWTQAPGTFETGDTPAYVEAGLDGSVFVLCANTGAIYSFDAASKSWNKVTQTPSPVLPDTSHAFGVLNAQTLYVVLDNSQIECYSGGAWSQVPKPPYGVADISIGTDGALWCLDPNGTVWRYASGSWVRQMVPTGLPGVTSKWNPVTEVVTGLHNDGHQYAFYISSGELYWSVLDTSKSAGGVWTAGTPLFSGCANLGVAYAPPSPNSLVVYGVTATGDVLLVQSINKTWTAKQFPVTSGGKALSLAGARIQFSATLFGCWSLWCVVDGTLYNGYEQQDTLTSPPTVLVPCAMSTRPQTVIPSSVISVTIAGLYTAVLDVSGQIWFARLTGAASGQAEFTQLSGSGVSSPIGAAQSAVGSCSAQLPNYVTESRIFARDTNDTLWIIRFTVDPNATAPYTWSQWHPLGNNCVFLANGPANVPSTDLFMLNDGYEVNVLSEDLTNGVWNDLVMLKPSGTNTDCEYVTRYVTELAITDENSLPQANFSVGVTADEAVGIWVGNALYNVTPSGPVQLTTDRTGKITFGFFAADIHAPTFSFTADGLAPPPAICPAQAVNNYLAGQSGALQGRPDFDSGGTTLMGAQMQSQPEWSGSPTPLVQSANQANAPTAAKAITQIYTIPLSPTGSSSQWQVAPSQTGVGSLESWGDFWNDLCSVGRDVEHAIKNAVLKVTQVTVDVTHKVVSFTMELANGMSQVLQLVINTARDVANAVGSVFRYIERGIDEVIDWLKSLFKWHDILNTKMVIETALNGLMSKLAENFDPNSPVFAYNLFKTYFDGMVNDVKQAFQNAESVFGGKTFGSAASSVPYPSGAAPMGSDALHPANVMNAQSNNGTQTNYVHTHATNYTSQGGTFPPTAMGDGTSGDDFLQALFEAIDQNLNQDPYKTNAMKSVSSLQQIFQNPQAFADVVIYDVINALEDAVLFLLDVIDSIVEVLFNFAGKALAGFQALFNKTIDIPVISWLYSKVSGHPLTMLDLLCLIMAVPITLIYKLTFGLPDGNPPFSDETTQELVAKYGDPAAFPWPAIASSTVSASPAPQLLGDFPFTAAFYLTILNSATYAICDVLTDTGVYMDKTNPPAKDAPPDPFNTFFSWCSIVTSMVSQWLSAPYDLFDGQTSAAQKWTLANWGVNFISAASALVFTIGSSQKSLAEFNQLYGVPLTVGIGFLLGGVGCATSSAQFNDPSNEYNVLSQIQNVIAPLPTTLKWLLTVEGEPDAAVAAALLLASDGVFDLANGALSLVGDLQSA